MPYWRTLKVDGALNEKHPSGVVAQAGLPESEWHEIVFDKSGKPKKVKDFEKSVEM